MLRLRPGIELTSSMRATLGLELARSHPPDLILLDLHLPDGSGLELIGTLRDEESLASTAIVVMSADASSASRRTALAAGADDYVTKPFRLSELLGMIDEPLPAGNQGRRADRARAGWTVPYGARTLSSMKSNRLELRLTQEERDLDASAAAAVGETLSEFFRQAARERAVQIIDEQRVISVDETEAKSFLDALDSPGPDTITRLRDLWDRPAERNRE